MQDQIQAVIAELQRHGIKGRLVKQKRGHPRIYFTQDGQERFYVLPNSGSDSRRGTQNALADVRRMIGVSGAKPKSSRKKGYRPKQVEAPKAPEAITPGSAGLAGLMARMEGTPLHRKTVQMQADRAWSAIWSSACRDVCGYGSVAAWFKASLRQRDHVVDGNKMAG